ncbi:ABC transporter ATP-binding protein [Actinopolymorpha pittospori]
MRDRWRAIRMLARMAFATDRWRTLGLLLEPVGQLTPPIIAVCLKVMTDGVLHHDPASVVVGAAGIAGARALWFVGAWTGSWLRVRLMEEVGFAFDREIATLTASISGLDHHERADYQDRLELLRQSQGLLGYSVNSLIYTVDIVVSGLATVVTLAVLSPWLLLLVLFVLPSIPVAAAHQRWSRAAEERSAAPARLARHLRGLTTDRDAGMELRVFGLRREILARFRTAWTDSMRARLTAERRAAVLANVRDLIFAVGFGGAILLALWRAVAGQGTVGEVVMTVYLCQRMQAAVMSPIQAVAALGSVLRAADRMLWLREYAGSVAERGSGSGPAPERIRDGIVFERVSFRYPGTESWALRDVSLHFHAGTVVALVGENGAGKTTLVKLLCRMYEPTKGRILVDGVDLAGIDVHQWRQRLSAAFQDFARLEFTAHHTVGLGDLPRFDDIQAVGSALDRAGASDVLPHLPDGADTRLGSSWDNGVELSTGQWQKLALGRALMRERPLLVFFDEPTASLDAQTEHGLFERYAATARSGSDRGMVTVLVSHRFSTVRTADLIVVVDDGEVSEVGSHEELLARTGPYAELYDLQARSYR